MRKNPFSALCIAVTLHQALENKAVLINGPPKPVFLSANGSSSKLILPHTVVVASVYIINADHLRLLTQHAL